MQPLHTLTAEEARKGRAQRLVEAMFASVAVNLVRQPTLTVKNTKDGYIAYDTDNLLPQRLNKLANTSPTHAAILDATSRAVAGYDVTLMKGETPYERVVVNRRGETLRQLVRKIAIDLVRFNGFALQVIPSKAGRIGGLYHQDFATVRIQAPDHEVKGEEEIGQVHTFQLSNDWERYLRGKGKDKQTYAPRKIRAYTGLEGLKVREEGKGLAPQLFYYSSYAPGEGYYPLPRYYGGLDYIQLEMEIGVYHLKSVQNGFTPSLYARWETDPGEQMRDKVQQMFVQNYMGANNARRALFGFGKYAPEVTTIPDAGNADIYNAISELATQKIISAHRLPSPVLAGLPGAGSLGGNSSEILTSSELWTATQIQPLQEEIIDTLLPLVRGMYDYSTATAIVIEDTQPLQFRVPFDQLKEFMTTEEIRETAGLPTVPEPDKGVLPQRMARQLVLDFEPKEATK